MMHQHVQKTGTIKNERKGLRFLKVGLRYGLNLFDMVARQQGYKAAAIVGSQFAVNEVIKLPRAVRLALQQRSSPVDGHESPVLYSPKILARLAALEVDIEPLQVNANAFRDHVERCKYPRNYAAGPTHEGGLREKKLIEYFVSLELLDVQQTDLVIDVASEWSIFPDVLRKLTGATVYQQDLIYQPGINDYRIGGNAAHMPVPDSFADKLVLHNAFEHFEGNADTEFILETWRVLKPGGVLCILPLYLAEKFHILTDPLVNRQGVIWNEGAEVIERPWWHNRFGRFYDPESFEQRVLAVANRLGFKSTIYHLTNIQEVVPVSDLRFALVMRKPR